MLKIKINLISNIKLILILFFEIYFFVVLVVAFSTGVLTSGHAVGIVCVITVRNVKVAVIARISACT